MKKEKVYIEKIPRNIDLLKYELVKLNMLIRADKSMSFFKKWYRIRKKKKLIMGYISELFLNKLEYYDYNFFMSLYEIFTNMDNVLFIDKNYGIRVIPYESKKDGSKSFMIFHKKIPITFNLFSNHLVKIAILKKNEYEEPIQFYDYTVRDGDPDINETIHLYVKPLYDIFIMYLQNINISYIKSWRWSL